MPQILGQTTKFLGINLRNPLFDPSVSFGLQAICQPHFLFGFKVQSSFGRCYWLYQPFQPVKPLFKYFQGTNCTRQKGRFPILRWYPSYRKSAYECIRTFGRTSPNSDFGNRPRSSRISRTNIPAFRRNCRCRRIGEWPFRALPRSFVGAFPWRWLYQANFTVNRDSIKFSDDHNSLDVSDLGSDSSK